MYGPDSLNQWTGVLKNNLSLHLHPLYVCASSYDSWEPVHKRTLCRNDIINGSLFTVYSSISTFIAYA